MMQVQMPKFARKSAQILCVYTKKSLVDRATPPDPIVTAVCLYI